MLTNRRSTTISLETYHLFPTKCSLKLSGRAPELDNGQSFSGKSYAFDRSEVGIFAED